MRWRSVRRSASPNGSRECGPSEQFRAERLIWSPIESLPFMFAKLMTITMLLACLAGGLLVLRHERLQVANQNALLHQRIAALRCELWQAQVQAAEMVRPTRLRQRLSDTVLAMQLAEPDGEVSSARWARAGSISADRP